MKHAWLRLGRSVAGRIALVVMGAVTTALILAATLSVWREIDRYTEEQREEPKGVGPIGGRVVLSQ